MSYQVSMMGWVGLGFEKVTHDQLWVLVGT